MSRAGKPIALVKGGGDLGTGVAVQLWRAGFLVVITETDRPTVVRRTVSFAEAVYEGTAEVEGIRAVCAGRGFEGVGPILDAGKIPVVVDPPARIRESLKPGLLVDAIMAKRNLGTNITDAPAVVALGPGFLAGRDVHAVIETMRGESLGRVITCGEALPDTGIPADRHGFGRERILRSPQPGVFIPSRTIGDKVMKGDVIGHVDTSPVVAQLDGIIRGMICGGLTVTAGLKLGDVDPEATLSDCYRVSDKALTIGAAVVEAAALLLQLGQPVLERAAAQGPHFTAPFGE